MKIYAHHDVEGTIRSLTILDAPEGAGMMLSPSAGVFVTEVEGLKLKADQLDFEALRETANNHKVSTPQARSKLARKR